MVPCSHVPGAGPCPNVSSTVMDFMYYFGKIYVICTDKNCVRHEKGYWRSDIQNKIQLLKQKYSYERKRYNSFGSHLKAIQYAKNTSFDNVLILEDDVRPVAKHTLEKKIIYKS